MDNSWLWEYFITWNPVYALPARRSVTLQLLSAEEKKTAAIIRRSLFFRMRFVRVSEDILVFAKGKFKMRTKFVNRHEWWLHPCPGHHNNLRTHDCMILYLLWLSWKLQWSLSFSHSLAHTTSQSQHWFNITTSQHYNIICYGWDFIPIFRRESHSRLLTFLLHSNHQFRQCCLCSFQKHPDQCWVVQVSRIANLQNFDN